MTGIFVTGPDGEIADAGFGAENSEGVIFGIDGDGGGGGTVGREKSLISSGGVNGFGVDPEPPVCFRAVRSDCMVLIVISGGGGASGGTFGRLCDAGGNPAGGGFVPIDELFSIYSL